MGAQVPGYPPEHAPTAARIPDCRCGIPSSSRRCSSSYCCVLFREIKRHEDFLLFSYIGFDVIAVLLYGRNILPRNANFIGGKSDKLLLLCMLGLRRVIYLLPGYPSDECQERICYFIYRRFKAVKQRRRYKDIRMGNLRTTRDGKMNKKKNIFSLAN